MQKIEVLETDYTALILFGYKNIKQDLDCFFFSECEKAMENNITRFDFFSNLINAYGQIVQLSEVPGGSQKQSIEIVNKPIDIINMVKRLSINDLTCIRQGIENAIEKNYTEIKSTQQWGNPFDDLFETFILYEVIETPVSLGHKSSIKDYHQYAFDCWLRHNKGWNGTGNKEQYEELITEGNFLAYLKSERKTVEENKKKFEAEKQRLQNALCSEDSSVFNGGDPSSFIKSQNHSASEIEETDSSSIISDEHKNDSITALVKEHFSALREAFNSSADFDKAIETIIQFFLNQTYVLKKPVFVKSTNIKSFAFALGEIWRSQKNEPITFDYLNFYKTLFSIFSNHPLDKKKIFSSNLYKYSISKT